MHSMSFLGKRATRKKYLATKLRGFTQVQKANLLSMKGKTGVILDQWEQQRHGARLLHRKTTFPSDPTTKASTCYVARN
uniref:Uncharacterized protein n=1 Tax=Oryza barthii TaxID=65489 RepID=A0A679BDN3_9ORYZ|nr:hypothetical protein [Oryza barthii]